MNQKAKDWVDTFRAMAWFFFGISSILMIILAFKNHDLFYLVASWLSFRAAAKFSDI